MEFRCKSSILKLNDMNTNNFNNLIRKFTLVLTLIILSLPGCKKDFLNENPKNAISEAIFWKTKGDAYQALMGCYNLLTISQGERFVNLNKTMLWMSEYAGYSSWRTFRARGIEIQTINPITTAIWPKIYTTVSSTNYFLDNIEKVDMDETEKATMIAEVRFLRAFCYFWLSQLYGNVPLVKTTLTFDEANSVSQASEVEVRNFILTELTEIASDLPLKQPTSEKGRIERGAALALKGRLLMAEERWSEAATTYKEIMDLNRYIIDPQFKKLFEDEGNNSNEIIFAARFMETESGEAVTQHHTISGQFGGWNATNLNQNFIDEFEMTDGKLISESGMYDPENPFENRDPRLYATALLPNYSIVKGRIFQGHPDSVNMVYGQYGPGITGYGLNKFFDPDYTGNKNKYGGDHPLIRYAEVLLSYLESKLEAGDNIDQNLLDETINKIRGREAVAMPSVTETDPNKLREIIRRERCVELAFEAGLRYWDLIRWKIAYEVINQKFYGMKVTDNPETYSGTHIINDKGNIFVNENVFYEYNYLWPLPQSELDINKNLIQNPGY